MNKGEVWFVEFPLEEDNTQIINRPVREKKQFVTIISYRKYVTF